MPARLRHRLDEAVVHRGAGTSAAYEAAAHMVRTFTFYDPAIVSAKLPGDSVRRGLPLVQDLRVGPLRLKGPVTVISFWERPESCGFTYQTEVGHVERGAATFEVTRSGELVRFRIESDSAPALWFVRIGAPFARYMQRRAIRSAFERVTAACQEAARGA